ncbi:MAG: HipA family kinase, partial [Oceanobacter sp.]
MLEVSEVIKKSEQGMGSAYFCSGSDGANYWVKGESAQREFQVNEWLAGHLAKEFGLPIAQFCLIKIDYDFAMYLPVDKSDIGAGVAFASTHVVGANELQRSELRSVPAELKRDLLVFDY